MSAIVSNIQQVRARIATACGLAQRPVQSVTLLAVSKTVPADAVRSAFDAGERRFGENYVGEGVDKIAALRAMIDERVDAGNEQVDTLLPGQPADDTEQRQFALL